MFGTGREPGFGQSSQKESREVGFRDKIVLEEEAF